MLEAKGTLAISATQEIRKFAPCYGGCGGQVAYRTNSKVLCEACRPARRAEQLRAIAEKRRRAKGVQQGAGAAASCLCCGARFIKKGGRSLRCDPCQETFRSEAARRLSKAVYATPEGRAAAHRYRADRCRTDEAFAINVRIKTYMAKSLRGGKQGRKWQSLVGYDLPTLMRHLERQFVPGMTWENRALWHVDHIQPLASFTFTSPDDSEFRAAWALTNLRPLWKADNLAKSDQRLFLI